MSHKRKQHFDDENSDDESVANMANVTRYDINNVSVETPVDNRSIDYSVALLKGIVNNFFLSSFILYKTLDVDH